MAATCATAACWAAPSRILGALQAHLALHLLLGLEPSALGRVIDVRRQASGVRRVRLCRQPRAGKHRSVHRAGLDRARRPGGRPAQPGGGAALAVRDGAPAYGGRDRDPASGTAAVRSHCPVLPQRPAGAGGRRPAARAGSRQSGAGGAWVSVRKEGAMTHTTDKTVLEHIEHLVAEEKKLYAAGCDVERRARAPAARSMSSSTAAGTCCASVVPCASSAATPMRPRCARPPSSRTTRVSPARRPACSRRRRRATGSPP